VDVGQSLGDRPRAIVAFERFFTSDAHGLSQAEISDTSQLSHRFRRGVVLDMEGNSVTLALCTRLHQIIYT